MYPTVPIALFGWPIVVLILFTLVPARRAVLVSFIGAWLFLPESHFKLAVGIPDYTKVTATVIGVLLGTIFIDFNRVLVLRPKWIDLPMAVWCICPLFSSISNNLGLYDGCSAVFFQFCMWGLPYVIGRMYFGDLNGLRDLSVAMVVGGLLYVPLCLFEVHFSPQLNLWIYGFLQHEFDQSKRYGGYRPLVFMQTGLTVGLWMTDATLIAIWFWSTGTIKRIGFIPIHYAAIGLLVTSILCKSTGALILLAIGISVLFLCRKLKNSLPLFCLILLIPTYITMEMEHVVEPETIGNQLKVIFDKDRVDSMLCRLVNEKNLGDRAWERPILGWGGWNRSAIIEDGKQTSIPDSLWIIAFGKYGILGLSSIFMTFLLPGAMVWRYYPPRSGADPRLMPLRLLSLLVVLYALDCISNAMVNPIYILAIGGIMGVLLRPLPQSDVRRIDNRMSRYSVASSV